MSSLKKFYGAMFGVAIGDAVGRPFEGSDPVSKEEIKKKINELPLLSFTDDTQMTIGLARSLTERRGFDPDDVMKKFIEEYDPRRGYGSTTTRVIQKVKNGEDWRTASREVMNGNGSYGNGAAMRAAPIGLVYQHSNEKIIEMAKASSLLTHSHPLGVEGAILQALGVGILARTVKENFNMEELLKTLKTFGSEVYSKKLDKIKELENADTELIRDELGCGSEAFNSVPTAIYCFLKSPYDFREVVLNAVALGGDTDTIASMAGGLAGAFLGEDALPKDWIQKLEYSKKIKSLAKDLFFLHVEEVLGKECEMCLSKENVRAYKVDPQGEDDVSNFILLCDRCKRESEKEKEEFLAKPRKYGKYRAVYRKAYKRS